MLSMSDSRVRTTPPGGCGKLDPMTAGRDLNGAASEAMAAVEQRALPGASVPASARVVLHFHPDADPLGAPVLRQIVAERRYVSQFVTGTSNGGLTAFPGGDRHAWERRIFAGAYDTSDPADRPVYGALSLDGDPYGAAPRFGSAYLRLRPEVLARASFAYPDSVFEPTAFGTADRFGLIEAFLQAAPADPLNHYIEAHVHGRVLVPDDVEAVVMDPSFDDEPTLAAVEGLGIPLERHPGYSVAVADLREHPEYRGAETLAVAERIAEDGRLTPAVIGRARQRRLADPQTLKRVWHCLARFGRGDNTQAG